VGASAATVACSVISHWSSVISHQSSVIESAGDAPVEESAVGSKRGNGCPSGLKAIAYSVRKSDRILVAYNFQY
jgi:hypothetical protein